jgi:hypothetical protein
MPDFAPDPPRERHAAMPCDHRIRAGHVELARKFQIAGRGKHEGVDPLHIAMHHPERLAAHLEHQSFGQRRHELAVVAVHLAGGVRVPGGGQRVARRIRREPAAAIRRFGGQRDLAVPGDRTNPRVADQPQRGLGIRAVGDDIAGADHVFGGESVLGGPVQQRPGRLKIAVAAAEQQNRRFENNHAGRPGRFWALFMPRYNRCIAAAQPPAPRC